MRCIKSLLLVVLVCALGYIFCDDYLGIDVSSKIVELGEMVSDGTLVSDILQFGSESNSLNNFAYNNDSNIYPYYEMLNDNEKKLYELIYANVMELSTSFSVSNGLLLDDVKKVMSAVYNDHPELFWVKNEYVYKHTRLGEVVGIELSYYFTSDDIDNAKRLFDGIVLEVVNEARLLDSDYEREKFVHDYLVEHVSYNEKSMMNQTAYSALVNKESVCAGYAKAFQYIMQKLGITTYYVTGYAMGDHAWNIVKLSDGFYNVDVTWDDTFGSNNSYFNMDESNFDSSHKRMNLSVNLPKCEGREFVNGFTSGSFYINDVVITDIG